MRPNRTTTTTAVALAALLGLTACGSTSSPKKAVDVSLSPLAAVRTASVNTVKAGSATFTMDLTVADGGTTTEITGSGAFDYTRKVGRVSVALPSALTQGKNTKIDEVVTPSAFYMSGELFGQPGKWVKVDVAKLGLSGLADQTDPSQMSNTLQAVTSASKVGPETVGGVRTTHYRGSLDAQRAYSLLSGKDKKVAAEAGASLPKTIPFDSWVDGQGRLVKLVEDFTITVAKQTQKMHMQMTFGDFGKPVTVRMPSAADIVAVPGVS